LLYQTFVNPNFSRQELIPAASSSAAFTGLTAAAYHPQRSVGSSVRGRHAKDGERLSDPNGDRFVVEVFILIW
jgi:hypothetical protein